MLLPFIRQLALPWLLLPALLLSVQTQANDAPPPKTITLSMPLQAKPHFQRSNPVSARLSKAFAALGYRLEFVFHPSLRSLALANLGQVDGELARNHLTAEKYPNLMRVEVPANYIQPAIYALANGESPDWRIRPIETLALARGSSLFERSVPAAFQQQAVMITQTNTPQQGMEMLNAGRVDALMLTRMQFRDFMQRNPELTSQLQELQPALPSQYLYTYLHKRHQTLLPALNQQLQRLLEQHPIH